MPDNPRILTIWIIFSLLHSRSESRRDRISDRSYLGEGEEKIQFELSVKRRVQTPCERRFIRQLRRCAPESFHPFLHPTLISFSFVRAWYPNNTRHGACVRIRVKWFRTVPKYDVVYSTAVQKRKRKIIAIDLSPENLCVLLDAREIATLRARWTINPHEL